MRTFAMLLLLSAAMQWEMAAQNNGGEIHVIRDCGRERWDLKILKDADTSAIDFATFKDATVDQVSRMRAFQPTEFMIRQWFEHTLFRVKTLLYGYSQNKDREYVLYLRDPVTARTIVAEIPDPDCPEVAATWRAALFRSEREWVHNRVGEPAEKLLSPVAVTVTGVGLYGMLNNQTGMAENGLEIHPVLSVDEIPPPPATGAPAMEATTRPATESIPGPARLRSVHRRRAGHLPLIRHASRRWRRSRRHRHSHQPPRFTRLMYPPPSSRSISSDTISRYDGLSEQR